MATSLIYHLYCTTTGEIIKDKPLQQSFTCIHPTLVRLEVFLYTYHRINPCRLWLKCELRAKKSSQFIRHSVNIRKVINLSPPERPNDGLANSNSNYLSVCLQALSSRTLDLLSEKVKLCGFELY